MCVCEYVYVQIIMRQLSAAPDDIGNEVPFEYKYARCARAVLVLLKLPVRSDTTAC